MEFIKNFLLEAKQIIDQLDQNQIEKIVDLLIEHDCIKTVADLYQLKHDKIANLPRMAEKSADNLLEAIEKSKSTTFARFLFSLGIRDVGESTAALLATEFRTIEAFLKADLARLQAIRDIGPVVSQHIIAFLQELNHRQLIEKLLALGIHWPKPLKTDDLPLKNKTFVLTGTLAAMSRDQAKEALEKLGATVSGSVSAKTYAVIVGESPGSKYDKARSLGVLCLEEKAFLALIGFIE